MAKVKQVMKPVSVKVAGRKRKCYHSKKHSIAKGESLLTVKDPAYGNYRGYCLKCGNDILDRAQADLDNLKADLNS
jgi:hypothetical protein